MIVISVHLLSSTANSEPQPEKSTTPQTGPARIFLDEFRPASMLKVPEHHLSKATFPVVDIHTHFHLRLHGSEESLEQFVSVMDRNQIALCVSLDGRLGDNWQEHADYLWKKYPDRFAIFVIIDWQGDGKDDDPATWACHRPEFARHTARQLAEAKSRGASGVKIHKQFGLEYRNPDGRLLEIDDPRWAPIWKACGNLNLPILIHTADPAAFFLPIDKQNERWEELSRHPEWSFHGDQFPTRDRLLAARNRVIAANPETTFIGAHVANNSEDLGTVGQWLDAYPNLYVDFASRIGELGRQPYSARDFLIKYQDRVLFGTDGPWEETRIRLYWRFLETKDEYFPYAEKVPPPQGMWQIYGVWLEDSVLEKIYWKNAARLLPDIAEKVQRFRATH